MLAYTLFILFGGWLVFAAGWNDPVMWALGTAYVVFKTLDKAIK